MIRGQLSVEYLFLALLLLALLGISLTALGRIRQQGDGAYAKIIFDKDVRLVADTAIQLCLLGPGNSRQIELEAPLEMHPASGRLQLVRGPFSYDRFIGCEAVPATLSHRTELRNEGGRILSAEST